MSPASVGERLEAAERALTRLEAVLHRLAPQDAFRPDVAALFQAAFPDLGGADLSARERVRLAALIDRVTAVSDELVLRQRRVGARLQAVGAALASRPARSVVVDQAV